MTRVVYYIVLPIACFFVCLIYLGATFTGEVVDKIKRFFCSVCPQCGAINTYYKRTDTGLLLDFSYSWMECNRCGYKDRSSIPSHGNKVKEGGERCHYGKG